MKIKQCLNNLVLIKLDKENDSIKLRNGTELYVDTSFEPERNATVTGEVWGLPSKLSYTGEANIGMPWMTPLELKLGDRVIVYYLSIINALSKEKSRYILEGEDRYVFIPYQNLFVKYGEGFVQPINGYCLIEPCEDPWWTAKKKRLEAIGLEAVRLKEHSNTNVCFGIIRYVSTPNREYVDEGFSDEGVDVSVGDTVVLRKISDIPLQYNLHAKIDDGKKYWRAQRRSILAKI